jgi:hypothetical protein
MASLPAAIRINTNAPFPAMVTGGAGIAVTKTNGIWSINFNMNTLGTQIAPPGNYPNDYIVVYDAAANTTFKMPLSGLTNLATGARTQRSVTASPIVIASNDQILNVNVASGTVACTLPAAATRSGVSLIFKDVGGQFGAHALTITPQAGETIDGLASMTMSTNRQFVELTPFNDTVNTGWMITG